MTTRIRTLNDIRHTGISVLTKELGAANAIRFLQQFSAGTGDYSRARKELLRDVTLDQLLTGLNRLKSRRSRTPRSHARKRTPGVR